MRLFKLHISLFLASLMLFLTSFSLTHLIIYKHEYKLKSTSETTYTKHTLNHYCSHFIYNALSDISVEVFEFKNLANYALKIPNLKENKRAKTFKKSHYGRDPPHL
ncbi:hypothetical protein SAMN05444278_101130 [Psychroflexus salarius]|uniref:Uncharacterized protein n=1 Tax=Psychroflexus salarius TaxID=1155689 RepID=A0A1M4SFC5_9FLAO|nr:hypothetical protein [Psychroflexus salarius]SHE30933.1 hypothetical protein SAMN05444278_101130 [Psychroflexus salarius]